MPANLPARPSIAMCERGLLPHLPGVYAVLRGDQVLYVGSSTNSLRARWVSHHRQSLFHDEDQIAWVADPPNVRKVEREWIAELQPSLNRGIASETLEYIGTSVPPQVAVLLRGMASSEGRTLSAIVRRTIEQSPVIKAEMRRNGKIK